MENKKKFRLFDAVLMAVVVVLVVESAAPAAAIGPSQFFWWILLLLLFFLPYGLISAELGTTYDDEGGIYDWIRKAFGGKWGGRAAWLYWINFPIWMASLAVLFNEVIEQIFKVKINSILAVVIELIFIAVVTAVCCYPVADSKWILNIAAIAKVVIMLSVGILGVYHAVTVGMANDFSGTAMLPKFDVKSLGYISVILFNFLGFEVVTTMAKDMENPKKQIPQAIIWGGILIAIFYLFAAFGMGAAIPVAKISTSGGLIDSLILLVGQNNWFVFIIGILFMYTLLANLISWSAGVNYVALYAAKNNDLPGIFKKVNKKEMPIGATFLNGIIAAVLVVIAPMIPNENIFWAFFSLNVVALLLSYVLMFPAFLKLRKKDPDTERPFKVPGNKLLINLYTYVPMVLLLITIFFTVVPLNGSHEEISTKLPIIIGIISTLVVGEIFISKAESKKEKK
ncbi:APC family permease [Companilactobacillus metriopterae]|uniref:APC family permease n=1 Tax=Companilactobacillus metriopterae TaxID=1909267 RepID=UPI00100AD552|nr:APC family permease [Companilactobacillus metriopterae]